MKLKHVLISYLYFIVYYLFAHKRGTLLREFSQTLNRYRFICIKHGIGSMFRSSSLISVELEGDGLPCSPKVAQCDDRCFYKVEAQSLPDEGDCLRVLLTGLIGHLCCKPS